ncbi:MAG: hypothetical protein R3B13_21425 [Polyangiaceae bacterium]
MLSQASLIDANEVLGAATLTGVRLAGWTAEGEVARLEVFHVEWEGKVFGELTFFGVQYLQMPSRTSWGYRMRLAPDAELPSRGDSDSTDIVFELYAEDGAEPSAFIVAERLEVSKSVRGAQPGG